jgi:hypothetical protein
VPQRARRRTFTAKYKLEILAAYDEAAAVTVRDRSGQTHSISADWFLSAIPVERFVQLLSPEVLAADPSLERACQLRTDWMNGPPAGPPRASTAVKA